MPAKAIPDDMHQELNFLSKAYIINDGMVAIVVTDHHTYHSINTNAAQEKGAYFFRISFCAW